MDFVSDTLFDGKRFRALTVIDTFTRECLAIHVPSFKNGSCVSWSQKRGHLVR